MYRLKLPQLSIKHDNDYFLTDAGIQTWLIHQKNIPLPHFAAFPLLKHSDTRDILRGYNRECIGVALRHARSDVDAKHSAKCAGFILETPTWRASQDWADKLGISASELAALNMTAVEEAIRLREEMQTPDTPIVVSGTVGPRGDAYKADGAMTAEEAREYHSPQMKALAEAGVDMVTAATVAYPEEAVGIVLAARESGLPAAIGFTVETDGRLPGGRGLGEAVGLVDAATGDGPAYYMVNCAHPDHFVKLFEGVEGKGGWAGRVRSVRANPSRLSHAELDQREELDAGDPEEFGRLNAGLRGAMKGLRVFGSCCGSDSGHLEQICLALAARESSE